ncbi:NAD(P)-dependent oxidoreductase [Pseudoalteromonas sp. SCSIO 43201]|uniref:NAD-dependent epimerase/dehydratase family protein n=1 Tax=Pseudoalteromonas sp. SCSIO 43201 TaxID=2822842 RepID=UPI002075E4C7|nr:NAD(P)-dependent oxidoreductase [Pseudoalteromonas sp. SCSIO 43201]USD29088.1 NAD(P)-dependent oxidoreductase [Pseudoalteromonas sp. SCSIO 43201]
MSTYTIFGGRGFIGSEIVSQLVNLGHSVFVPPRDDETIYSKNLGRVVYCAGYGDCEKSPFDVLEANCILLSKILEKANFERLIYISSTRIYMNQTDSREDMDITICNDDPRRLFNLTKLVGEELCLKSRRDICVLRPSNVYGLALTSPLFLPSITRNAVKEGVVNMYISKSYSKDYVSVIDVANAAIKLLISENSEKKIYNVASGFNVSAAEIADLLSRKTGCKINWHTSNNENDDQFPITNIDSMNKEFGFIPRNVLDDLENLIEEFQEKLKVID